MSTRFTYLDAAGTTLAGPSDLAVAVHDHTTGLIWSRATLGVTGDEDDDENGVDHTAATQLVADLDLAGATDWRLPTIQQLLTLVDYGRRRPAIDIDAFPDTRSNWYWTSTPAAWSPSDYAWCVSFGYGDADLNHRYDDAFVRAVRVAAPLSGQ